MALDDLIREEIHRPVAPAAGALVASLRQRYGEAVQAVLFYGSGLRGGDVEEAILDLYVLVDRYRNAYSSRRLALANALLPPNVFYLHTTLDGKRVRAKYVVLSLDQLDRGTSPRCFESYFWGRLAQPCALIYARDGAAVEAVVKALAQAVATFVARSIPLAPPVFDAGELWRRGLAASYETELRAERPERAARLVEAMGARCQRLTAAVTGTAFAAVLSPRARWLGRQAWRLRRVQGRLLQLMRLMKAAFTFAGGVDYVLWKIERHSGVKIEATPRLRRHPLLAGWGIAWRLYRRGGFR